MEEIENKIIEKDMTPKLIGETYLKYPNERSKCRYSYGLYICQYCGSTFEAMVNRVRSKNTKSCGCLRGQNHNLTHHRFYNIAISMIQRCTNPNSTSYKYYGGRGITICDEWLDIATFITWAESTYPNIEGYTLDRIDNDKGYSPENCRWVDKTTQAINRRMQKNNTSGVVGVRLRKNKWISIIKVGSKEQWIGSFITKEEAILARDNYIVENKIPYKLSTDY